MLTHPDPAALSRVFQEAFGGLPDRLVLAPGRVNLIGEHIDYNGLPVLPMAIERSLAIAFRRRDDRRVLLVNLDRRFAPVAFTLDAGLPAEAAGAWDDYARAAAHALRSPARRLRGMDGVIGSTVPVASGLSSSSALVVATALALLDAADLSLPPHELMDLLARGERSAGLQGGGMDQAVILGARAGAAARIAFRPGLLLDPIPVPSDWQVVLASSLVEAAKAGRVRDTYNTRVTECRTALDRFASSHWPGTPPADYAELMDRLPAAELLTRAAATLGGALLRRFRHVVSEAARVDDAVRAMRRDDPEAFGAALVASHRSLRDDYEVSCPELDELVECAMSAGADGARLTGAGLGGYIVCLTRRARAPRVMAALWSEYYVPRAVEAVRRSRVLFATRAGDGARVMPFPSGGG